MKAVLIICGVAFAVIVCLACCKVSSICSREEEKENEIEKD